jgi:hypothetical protein
MKALSIIQPWASLVAVGAKKIETRSWATNYRGPLAIHASKRHFDTRAYFDRELHLFAEALGLPDIYSFDKLPCGAVVATCKLVDCLIIKEDGLYQVRRVPGGINDMYRPERPLPKGNELAFGDYAPGRNALLLGDVKHLPEPILAKGKLGLWNWEYPEVSSCPL